MRPLTALLAVATAVLVFVVADATVQSTCKEAAAKDKQVDYEFCMSELGKHRFSPGKDTWGLAKIAAEMGINNAEGAVTDIEGLQAKPDIDVRMKVALEQCHDLYKAMGLAFARADEEINGRNYTAGKAEAAKAISQAHQCDAAFKEVGCIPSPLKQRSSYTEKIAIICTAITNLIN
jgi:pectinesterase inhibitor-like protein